MKLVTFISLGPGEAELITLKGYKALQSSELIYYPSTILRDKTSSSRALNILVELGINEEKLIPFNVPMNKERSLAIQSYEKVSEIIKQQYNKDISISVVAEGDAGFYSSIHYIYDNLIKNNIEVKHIAGVPAFIACGALAGIHIAKQEEELCVIPGIITQNQLEEKIKHGNSIVIMKASQCEEIIKRCIMNLSNLEYHYFENAGLKDKEFYTKNHNAILSRKFPYFSLVIIKNYFV